MFGASGSGNKSQCEFALLETGPGRQQATTELGLELVLTTGERLRIGAGVDSTALRRVLEALRA